MVNLSNFSPLLEISLIASIDGGDCGEESHLHYWGLIIWITLAVYLMVGQFVICEEYFVPILARLGDRFKMAEDVQGATLLAVGSSSPELFTALLGVIFYPNDNPGPGTNVGSAVFNMCIIVGLSAIFAPKAGKLQMVPFLRDSISYMIGLIMMYLFYSVITPHFMDLWESIVLTLWWVIYVIMVYRTDLLASRCCCCVPDSNKNKTIKEIEINSIADDVIKKQDTGTSYVALGDNDGDNDILVNSIPMHKPSFLKKKSVIKSEGLGGRIGVQYDSKGHPLDLDDNDNPNNIVVAPGALGNSALDDDLQELLDELNRRQRQNVNKGWVVVVMPAEQAHKSGLTALSSSGGNGPIINVDPDLSINANVDQDQDTHPHAHAFVRRRTLMETLAHEQAALEARRLAAITDIDEDEDDIEHGHSGRGTKILHGILMPWTKLFHWTLPTPEGSFATKHIYLTIVAIIVWLGILTFLVVDASEKIGNCFGMPGDLLGITLLAVGSSLPDCISSIIVARQMKLDMAVANAFGSNIFDVNLCVGISFVLGSLIAGGKSLDLGDKDTFGELILAAGGFMFLLWGMMWCTIFRLERWIGYVLSITYVGYICVFSVLFVAENKGTDPFGDS